MSWRRAVEQLGVEFARANEFLKELDAIPEIKTTVSAARARWTLSQAEVLVARLHEHPADTPPAVELKRVEEADKAIRLAEKAIEHARELMAFVLRAREERKRFSQDLALRLARAKLERQRTVP